MVLVIQHRQPNQELQLPADLHPLVQRILLQRKLRSGDELDLSLKNLLAPDSLLGVGGQSRCCSNTWISRGGCW